MKTLISDNRLRSYSKAALAGLTLSAFAVQGQVAPTYTAGTAAIEEGEEETIVLSPFEVSSEEDSGYVATNTLAGTRIRTDLRDIGSAISVITKEFLRDTGARNTEDLFVYTTNTEIGGVYGNYTGAGNGQRPDETGLLLRPNTNNRVRGLGNAENTRDFFRTDIPWDGYIVDRVDLQRGPNSILFGIGSAAGVVNASLNGANFRDAGNVEFRFGSFGSYRGSFDYNKELIDDELAVRVDALYDKTYFRQDPAFNEDTRYFGALRYEPKALKRGSASTTFKVNFEHGEIEANRPRSLPPLDRITQWFGPMGRKTYNSVDARNPRASVPGSGAVVRGNPNYQPWLGDIYGGSIAFFGDPNSPTQTGPLYSAEDGRTFRFGIGANGTIDQNIRGLPFDRRLGIVDTAQYAQNAGLDFSGDYKNVALQDTSVFDFYNLLIDGPNKSEVREFDAFNASVTQTFLNNRLGVELAFDSQEYEDVQDALFSGSNVTVTVDVNDNMPDGSANPNVGRPMIISRSTYGSSGRTTDRETVRATAFGEIQGKDFLDDKSWLAKVIGRHVFTGLYSDETYDHEAKQYGRFMLDSSYGPLTDNGNGFDPAREIQVWSYLGPDLRSTSSASGLNLSNLTAFQSPTATQLRYFDSRWKPPVNPATPGYVNPSASWVNPFNGSTLTESENPANYGGWVNAPMTVLDSRNGDRRLLTREARLSRDKVESMALVWQGYFFDGTVVGTFGWRNDDAEAFTKLASPTSNGNVDISSPDYRIPDEPYNSVLGETTSWSVVVHTPNFIKDRLPWGANLSVFYNASENFEPAAGRVDMLGNPYPAPTGDTKDYGFVVSALNDRVSLKVTWYETSAASATYGLSNTWFIGAVESRAWVAAKKFEAGLKGDPKYSGENYNYGRRVNGVFTQTPEDRALQQKHVDAVLSNFAPAIWPAWNMSPTDERWTKNAYDPWNASLGGSAPAGLTAISDTEAKGEEYELMLRPSKGWDVAINAARTEALRSNVAGGTLAEWVNARNELWNGVAGDIRMWSGTGSGSIKQQWNNTFYNNYSLQQLLNGSAVPELREWRVNVVTNYRFSGGRLKGFNVGGSFRWEDSVGTGYPSIKVPSPAGGTLNSYDISSPYFGPREESWDFWAGYQMKVGQKVNWRIQLNVRNAFGSNKLVPINNQPDGTPAAYRIKEGRTGWITNTISF